MYSKFFLILILFKCQLFFAQEVKENQIRVVGSYQETVFAKKFELNFLIQEVTSMSGGEKQVIKSNEEVKNEFLNFLKQEKLYTGELNFVNYNNQNYGSRGANYSIVLNDFNKANQIIQNAKIAGIANMTIKFLYEYSDSFYNELSAKAIDNAKMKANFMADKLNKKIGKVISVDDNTNTVSLFGTSNINSKKSDKESQQEIGYSIFITYELLDK